MKKKVAATRIIAAAEVRISILEFERTGCLGRDGGDVILAGGSEGSAAGGVAACDGGICGFGGVVETKCSGAIVGGATLGGILLGGTGLGGAVAIGTFWGEIGLGGTGLGVAWLGGVWRVASREASGALGRGT